MKKIQKTSNTLYVSTARENSAIKRNRNGERNISHRANSSQVYTLQALET